jgi:hypothetical protein
VNRLATPFHAHERRGGSAASINPSSVLGPEAYVYAIFEFTFQAPALIGEGSGDFAVFGG